MKKIISTLLIATTIANASICDAITTKVDGFTDVVSKSNPLDFSASDSPLLITKHIDGTNIKYQLILPVRGSGLHVELENVDVKFFDGSTYSFTNANMNIHYSDGYLYTASIHLTNEQVVMLKSKKIQKYRLAIYHRELIPKESIRFNDFVNCLTAVEKG